MSRSSRYISVCAAYLLLHVLRFDLIYNSIFKIYLQFVLYIFALYFYYLFVVLKTFEQLALIFSSL